MDGNKTLKSRSLNPKLAVLFLRLELYLHLNTSSHKANIVIFLTLTRTLASASEIFLPDTFTSAPLSFSSWVSCRAIHPLTAFSPAFFFTLNFFSVG